ncbi:MAG: hypothetical protein ABIZ80_19525 [Bryobacteraceae bacterium]
MSTADDNWTANYFNYFTEIEEHFQRARGTGLFLLSPLDWALIEIWKDGGIPLEAVVRGIDVAFEKWRARKSRTQLVNSLAFCAQAVLTEAKHVADTGQPSPPPRELEPAFPLEEIREYLSANAGEVERAGYPDAAAALNKLAAELEVHYRDLEQLEQLLTAIEEKLVATLKSSETEEQLFEARREMDAQLRPYRGKMSADQIAMLERQFLERSLLERVRIPRLSLFYLR